MQTNKPVSLFVDKHPKIIKISYTIHPYMPLIIRCKKKKKKILNLMVYKTEKGPTQFCYKFIAHKISEFE